MQAGCVDFVAQRVWFRLEKLVCKWVSSTIWTLRQAGHSCWHSAATQCLNADGLPSCLLDVLYSLSTSVFQWYSMDYPRTGIQWLPSSRYLQWVCLHNWREVYCLFSCIMSQLRGSYLAYSSVACMHFCCSHLGMIAILPWESLELLGHWEKGIIERYYTCALVCMCGIGDGEC